VQQTLAAGQDLILEIDWQGARQIRAAMPEAIGIFILPPTRAALEQRLRERRTDSPEVIARRLRDAVADMSHWQEFQYAIVNEDFGRALHELGSIIQGSGSGLDARRPALKPVVEALLDG